MEMNTQHIFGGAANISYPNAYLGVSSHSIPIFRTIALDRLTDNRRRRQQRQRTNPPLWQREWKPFNLMNANELKNCKHLLIRFRRAVKKKLERVLQPHTSLFLVRLHFFTSLRILPSAEDVLRLSYFALIHIAMVTTENIIRRPCPTLDEMYASTEPKRVMVYNAHT